MAACADPSMKAQLDWETPTKSLKVLLETFSTFMKILDCVLSIVISKQATFSEMKR